MKHKNIFNIITGVVIFVGMVLLLPKNIFNLEQRYVLATMLLMIYWWITRPIHLAITALLPILINSIFIMAPMKTILDDYFSSIVVLIIGANILMATWSYWKLDKRIALKALSVIGISVNHQIVIWFIFSVILSMFLPNVVVVASLCPIAYSMMKYCSIDNIDYTKSKTSFLILLSITWGAGLGGFGTPLGGAMNLVVINYIESFIGGEYSYITWSLKVIPFLIILSLAIIVYLIFIKKDISKLPGSKVFFKKQLLDIGKISKAEIISLCLFIIAVVLAFTRPLYKDLLPNLQPQYVFLILAFISFFIRIDKNNRLITWTYAVKNIRWGLIILFSGGLAIGKLIVDTGVASSLALLVTNANITNELLLISILVALGIFLANTSSNTAACAVLIPIVIGITQDLGLNTMAYIYVVAISCNVAYVLPTSIRAVPIDYGLDTKFMFKKGLVAVLISYIIIVSIGYVFIIL